MKQRYVEVEWCSVNKKNRLVCGDSVVSKKIKGEDRIVSVIADGLGSGIKANVLSTLTSTMACRFISSDMGIRKAAEIIMKTLPECSVRKIAYSTFLIIDSHSNGVTQVIEYSTPASVVIRENKVLSISKNSITVQTKNKNENTVQYYSFKALQGDRIVCYTDGVSQAGIGSSNFPLGWTEENVRKYIVCEIKKNSSLSARDLSQNIVSQSKKIDRGVPQDDTTCMVHYFREPRRLLLASGPPYDKTKDVLLSEAVKTFEGRKIICGGTTAKIVAREFGENLTISQLSVDSPTPPASSLKGIDMVTEGCVTLSKLYDVLRECPNKYMESKCTISLLVQQLLASDYVRFVIGTKINEAHQYPEFPVDLDIRKNIMRRIAYVLENDFMKQVELVYI